MNAHPHAFEATVRCLSESAPLGECPGGQQPPPARILHLVTDASAGEAQRGVFNLCEHHDRRQYEPHLACHPGGPWTRRAQTAGDHFHPLPRLTTAWHPQRDARALWAIFQLLRRGQFDVVHTHDVKTGWLGRLAARRVPVPAVVHTYRATVPRDQARRWPLPLQHALERLIEPVTDCVITGTEGDRARGRRDHALRWDRARVVPPGINYAELDARLEAAAIRRQWGLPERGQLVLVAGIPTSRKAMPTLVEPFQPVLNAHPETLVLVLQRGPRRPRNPFRTAACGMDSIRRLDWPETLTPLIKTAGVFALATAGDGLGEPVLEALLLGKPVVIPAGDGAAELVHHGETGLLYDAGKMHQLVSHLDYLLAHPSEGYRLGVNARRLTRPRFSAQQMARNVEQIYAELLAIKRPHQWNRPTGTTTPLVQAA